MLHWCSNISLSVLNVKERLRESLKNYTIFLSYVEFEVQQTFKHASCDPFRNVSHMERLLEGVFKWFLNVSVWTWIMPPPNIRWNQDKIPNLKTWCCMYQLISLKIPCTFKLLGRRPRLTCCHIKTEVLSCFWQKTLLSFLSRKSIMSSKSKTLVLNALIIQQWILIWSRLIKGA